MATTEARKLESRAYINGAFVSSLARPPILIAVHSSSTDSFLGSVEAAASADVDAAVSSATAAFHGPWGSFTGLQRSECLLKFAELFEEVGPKVAEIESLSMGAPISVQVGRLIPNAVQVFKYYAGQAHGALQGESWPVDEEEGALKLVQRQPMGVCALIAAWNATVRYFAIKTAPALACGNTVIFKASEKSPLGVLLLAPLFAEAGFPPGVVNIISGAETTGELLARHMGISMISFTGSRGVGRSILKASAETNLKRVTLELGGKNPAIIFADANLQRMIPYISQSILALTGQVCVAAGRVLVQEEVYEEVVAGVKTFLEGSRALVGDPMEKSTMIGPLVDERQFERVMGFISKGKDEAELASGGERIGEKGFFIQPTLFLNPGKEATIYNEEIFGPVMTINQFKTEEEAIEMANDTECGLFASVYTADIAKALRVAGKIEAGTVEINKAFGIDLDSAFGGWKGSGLGREGGSYGLKEFLQEKTIKIGMS